MMTPQEEEDRFNAQEIEREGLLEKLDRLKQIHDALVTRLQKSLTGRLFFLEMKMRHIVRFPRGDIRRMGLVPFFLNGIRKTLRLLAASAYNALFAFRERLTRRAIEAAENRFEIALDRFLEKAARHPSGEFVAIFSGTQQIKEVFGNRPMRQTRVRLEKDVPVFFSYFRWHRTSDLPSRLHPLLFQSPIDLTMKHFDKIVQARLPGKKKVFVASFPHSFLVRHINGLHTLGWHTIYDVRDNWEAFEKVGMAKWYDADVERYLANNAEACCCVARPLRDKLQQFTTNKTVRLNPNAYDVHFLSDDNKGRTAPRSGEKIAGYFGHLTTAWFDWNALNRVAGLLPDWTFEVVGRNSEGHPPLRHNIRLSGPKSHAELNEITKRWRTAMICFTMGPLADGVDPIKIYEYLALGMPTVSFTMPQIHDYPYVFPASSPQEFADNIVKASEVPLERSTIDEFISNNTWSIRVQQMLDFVLKEPDQAASLHAIAQEPSESGAPG